MRVSRSAAEIRSHLDASRTTGRRVALVPTMGNLHAGHLALVRRAVEEAEVAVATIFVNPLQFGEGEDYGEYPRTLDADLTSLEELGVQEVFVPDVTELYPQGPNAATRIDVPTLGDILCGASRPGHFSGVATIVNILFDVVQPDLAVFGRKDYQQTLVVRRMVQDLKLPVEIVVVPTVRETDGLAMSSRNRYLDGAQRVQAPALYGSLTQAKEALDAGEREFEAIEARGRESLTENGFRPDYFVIRRAADLAVPDRAETSLVLLAAAQLGKARLIDNLLWSAAETDSA